MHGDNVHICMKTSFEYHSLTITYVKRLVGSKMERTTSRVIMIHHFCVQQVLSRLFHLVYTSHVNSASSEGNSKFSVFKFFLVPKG